MLNMPQQHRTDDGDAEAGDTCQLCRPILIPL